MEQPVPRLLARLEGVRRSGTGWTARCPSHEDRRASLSVGVGRNRCAVVHCHAGCDTAVVVGTVGLAMSDLCPPHESAKEVIATYDYHRADGALLYQVVRFHPKDFRQRRPDGSSGWIWSLDGVERVLYRLPELRGADRGRTVLVVEGEKDADRLAALGFVATTNAGGAGKWQRGYAAELAGRRVAILPDADDAGRRHAHEAAVTLLDTTSEVRVVELPDLPPKGDVSTWLDGGGTADVLKRIIRDSPLVTTESLSAGPAEQSGRQVLPFITARQLAQQTTEDVDWIAPPWVALGAITELDGKPKVAGKTTLLAHLIVATLDGAPFLGRATHRTPVVLLTEQGPASLRATLARADLLERDDLYIVLWRDIRGTSWPTVAEGAAALCRSVGAKLLIVDTLPQFARMGGDTENDSGAAFQAMEPLQAAAASGLAVLVSRHDRKGGGEVGESARGSGAFTGTVDIVLALRRGDGESRPTIRHLHALSRFEETPGEVVIELTDEGFVMRGSASNFAVEEAKAAVLAMLAGGALTTEQLTTATGLKQTALQGALTDLTNAGLVDRHGAGKAKDPYRYSRSSGVVPEPIADAIGPADTHPDVDRPTALDLRPAVRSIFGDDLIESGPVA